MKYRFELMYDCEKTVIIWFENIGFFSVDFKIFSIVNRNAKFGSFKQIFPNAIEKLRDTVHCLGSGEVELSTQLSTPLL